MNYFFERKDLSSSEAGQPILFRHLMIPATLTALVFMPIFWILKNGFINADGLIKMQSLLSGIRILHFDEMLATLLITRIWESGIFGINPENSMSAFSVVFGGLYVWVTVVLGGQINR